MNTHKRYEVLVHLNLVVEADDAHDAALLVENWCELHGIDEEVSDIDVLGEVESTRELTR